MLAFRLSEGLAPSLSMVCESYCVRLDCPVRREQATHPWGRGWVLALDCPPSSLTAPPASRCVASRMLSGASAELKFRGPRHSGVTAAGQALLPDVPVQGDS